MMLTPADKYEYRNKRYKDVIFCIRKFSIWKRFARTYSTYFHNVFYANDWGTDSPKKKRGFMLRFNFHLILLVDIFMAIKDCNSKTEFFSGSNSILHDFCSNGRNYSTCWSWMHDSLWSQIWIPWDWRIYLLSVVVLMSRCDYLQRY